MELAKMVLKRDRRALARLITLVENESPEAREAIRTLHPHTGGAHIIGVTGPPGGGKSTLVSKLAKELRNRDKTVGIVAVDPSSPFTGGALLGDRIRMSELSTDPGVFIRSMGTRGHLGGLARATADVVKLLDAFKKDTIFIETVGTGQAEVDVVKIAHTTMIVTMPGMGDDIQTLKAGIMEIGDIFVVNKADMDGADKKVAELEAMLELGEKKAEWHPPVIKTQGRNGEGMEELLTWTCKHHDWLKESGQLVKQDVEKSRNELLRIAGEQVQKRILEAMSEKELDELSQKVAQRTLDPYEAASRIMVRIGMGNK